MTFAEISVQRILLNADYLVWVATILCCVIAVAALVGHGAWSGTFFVLPKRHIYFQCFCIVAYSTGRWCRTLETVRANESLCFLIGTSTLFFLVANILWTFQTLCVLLAKRTCCGVFSVAPSSPSPRLSLDSTGSASDEGEAEEEEFGGWSQKRTATVLSNGTSCVITFYDRLSCWIFLEHALVWGTCVVFVGFVIFLAGVHHQYCNSVPIVNLMWWTFTVFLMFPITACYMTVCCCARCAMKHSPFNKDVSKTYLELIAYPTISLFFVVSNTAYGLVWMVSVDHTVEVALLSVSLIFAVIYVASITLFAVLSIFVYGRRKRCASSLKDGGTIEELYSCSGRTSSHANPSVEASALIDGLENTDSCENGLSLFSSFSSGNQAREGKGVDISDGNSDFDVDFANADYYCNLNTSNSSVVCEGDGHDEIDVDEDQKEEQAFALADNVLSGTQWFEE